jgi:hypothetical protein
MEHYHKRSNVQSTFSAVKGKFGDSVMSKNDTARSMGPLAAISVAGLVLLRTTIKVVAAAQATPPAWFHPGRVHTETNVSIAGSQSYVSRARSP